ncbi:MAG: tetratricopeptide repeat protein [Alphaproteobacteria bacterium]
MAIMMGENGAPDSAGLISDSDAANFTADVIEASKSVPVIVDFWATWCEPCKTLGPTLEKLVVQAGGLVKLVKIDVDANKQLAAQLRVQSVPSVFGFKDGQPVDAFTGAQPESQIKAFIERLTGNAKTPSEETLTAADAALQAGDAETAIGLYAQVLSQDQASGDAIAGLIRCYIATGESDHARELVSGLDDKTRTSSIVAAAITALELVESSADAGDVSELTERLGSDENDHQTRLDLAQALYGGGDVEAAFDQLLESIGRDPKWNDDAARKQLLKLFEATGVADERVVAARKRLSTVLFS